MARKRRRFGKIFCLALIAGMFSAGAQGADDLDREFQFASGLVEMGFPDYAERLIDRLIRQNPDQETRAQAVKAQILVARRRFDEAEMLVKDLPPGKPSTEATRLAVANGFYRIGESDRARALYQEFFDQYRDEPPADPDVQRFFQDAAYRFGQMMERTGEYDRAIQAFDTLLKSDPDPALVRRLRVETADLMMRAARHVEQKEKREKYLTRARELCEKVHWGGLDLWFGRTIPILANIEIIRGKPEEARRVIESYLDILTEIDSSLEEDNVPLAFSPMAGTRFLLGTLFEEEGDRLLKKGKEEDGIRFLGRALREYFNVFAKYGDSDWGPDAGERAEDMVDRLEKMGRTVRVDFGPHKDRAAESQFRMAALHFQEGRYAEAAEGYLRALSAFPGAGNTGVALTNLLMSYIHLDDSLRLRATALYIGDRHRDNPEAGLALLRAGRYYYEQKNPEMYRWMYDCFARNFHGHERMPAVLFTLSQLATEEGDSEGASKYLQTLMNQFPGDEYYLRALYQQAWRAYEAGRYADAAARFAEYVDQSHPSHLRAQAQYLRGDSHMQLGELFKAIQAFRELLAWLTPLEGTGYAGTADELERNRELKQTAFFQIGYALSRVTEPEDRVPAFRAAAIQELLRFVETYGDADLAPKALNLVGTIQLELNRTEEAAATFERLQARYPDSEDGRSALYAQIRAAMKVGRSEVAREALARMRQRPEEYRPEQFAGVGRIMLEGGLPAEAAEAFQLAIDSGTDDRRVLEQGLYGLGRASYAVGNHEAAIEALNTFVDKYPRSGLLFDVKMLLGRAYRDEGRFSDAVMALREVFQLGSSDAVLLNTASAELARVQLRQAEKLESDGKTAAAEEAFLSAVASYQRIAMLVDPNHPDLRPLVEESLIKSVELFQRLNRFSDVVEAAEQYLRDFPEGEKVEEMRRYRADARLKVVGGD